MCRTSGGNPPLQIGGRGVGMWKCLVVSIVPAADAVIKSFSMGRKILKHQTQNTDIQVGLPLLGIAETSPQFQISWDVSMWSYHG